MRPSHCKKISWYISQYMSVWASKMGNLKIRGLGTNVNQMAHVANGQGYLPGEEALTRLSDQLGTMRKDSEEIWAQQFMIKTLKLFSLKGRRARGRCVEKALCRKTLAFQPGFQPPEATMKGALNFILFLLLISTGDSHWADMNRSQRPRERSRIVHVVSFSKFRTRWTADLKGREGTQHTRHNYYDLFYSVLLITCCIKQIIIF